MNPDSQWLLIGFRVFSGIYTFKLRTKAVLPPPGLTQHCPLAIRKDRTVLRAKKSHGELSCSRTKAEPASPPSTPVAGKACDTLVRGETGVGVEEQLDPLSNPCSYSWKQETGVPVYLPAAETTEGPATRLSGQGFTGRAASLGGRTCWC